MQNSSCSIRFSSTFHGISRKFGLLFKQGREWGKIKLESRKNRERELGRQKVEGQIQHKFEKIERHSEKDGGRD